MTGAKQLETRLTPARVGVPVRLPRLGSLLRLWHLCSLDAPSVAAVWTWWFAEVNGIALSPVTPLAMFLAVWILYTADRLLDAAALREPLEARHRFHRRHARRFRAGMVLAGAGLLLLLPRLGWPALHLYLLLGGALLLWAALVHLGPRVALPKEAAVGLFFAAATTVPELANGVSWRHLHPHAVLGFALLCTCNCLWINLWESPVASAPLRRGLQAASAVLLLTPFLPRIGGSLQTLSTWPVALAAAGLLLLGSAGSHLGRTERRAAADLVLLTPLLLAPFLR